MKLRVLFFVKLWVLPVSFTKYKRMTYLVFKLLICTKQCLFNMREKKKTKFICVIFLSIYQNA